MAQWRKKLAQSELDAELAVLLEVTNLPAGSPLANARAIPEAAVRRLMGSVCSGLSVDYVRGLVAEAVDRLQADGFLHAPSDTKRCWRLTHNGTLK